MKADLSKLKFRKTKKYSGVLHQMGRAVLDSDVNEAVLIEHYRDQTVAADSIGMSGTPEADPGFTIKASGGTITIGKGRYYVDGLLCENDCDGIGYEQQRQLINAAPLGTGSLLVYLKAWERHVTPWEDPGLLETALGGPDTSTRIQNAWQVLVTPIVPNADAGLLKNLIASRDLLLQQVNDPKFDSSDPVQLQTLPGIRAKLEEVGRAIDAYAVNLPCSSQWDEWGKTTASVTGSMDARTKPGAAETRCDLPPSAGFLRLENQLYRVEVHSSGELGAGTPPTFTFSRDNGSIVTEIRSFDVPNKTITVADLGRDDTLGFAPEQWVEISNEELEYKGQSGQLLQIQLVDPAGLTVTFHQAPLAIGLPATLRRWDMIPASSGAISMSENWTEVEDGIQVRFTKGTYRAMDYWTIPARSESGTIEWPPEEDPCPTKIRNTFRPPQGITYRYAKLALIDVKGKAVKLLSDCRRFFPSATALWELFYLSGDGQIPTAKREVPERLQVGVSNGKRPVAGAMVRFRVTGGGQVLPEGGSPAQEITVLTIATGIAACSWTVGASGRQAVTAELMGPGQVPVHLPVTFTARSPLADEVVYNPTDCKKARGVTNVQLAIDALCNYQYGAKEISYDPSKCNKVSGANNVQDAIDALCKFVEPRLRVKQLLLEKPRQQLELDAKVQFQDFQPGIRIILDGKVDPLSINAGSCFLVAEVPQISGSTPVFNLSVVNARVLIDNGEILIQPTREAFDFLANRVRENMPVRIRLYLKGGFIWSADNPNVYLDGNAFAQKLNGQLALRLPSGDDIRGGDFEMWFTLVPRPSITGLFNTGVVDASGALLANGAIDPHYVLVKSPQTDTRAFVVNDPPIPPWLPNSNTSKWIGPNQSQGPAAPPPAGGDYTYSFNFDVIGDPTGLALTGKWAADNSGTISFKGSVTQAIINNPGFGVFSQFSISGLGTGPNEVLFVVNNAGPGPTGLRVEWSSFP